MDLLVLYQVVGLYGMVWCGMVWYGIVWYIVLNGLYDLLLSDGWMVDIERWGKQNGGGVLFSFPRAMEKKKIVYSRTRLFFIFLLLPVFSLILDAFKTKVDRCEVLYRPAPLLLVFAYLGLISSQGCLC